LDQLVEMPDVAPKFHRTIRNDYRGEEIRWQIVEAKTRSERALVRSLV
jgi:hypothetical protein